jgi:hypothetical protein
MDDIDLQKKMLYDFYINQMAIHKSMAIVIKRKIKSIRKRIKKTSDINKKHIYEIMIRVLENDYKYHSKSFIEKENMSTWYETVTDTTQISWILSDAAKFVNLDLSDE